METKSVAGRLEGPSGAQSGGQKRSLVQPLKGEFRLLLEPARGPVTPEASKCYWNSPETHFLSGFALEVGCRDERPVRRDAVIDPLELSLACATLPVTPAAEALALARSAVVAAAVPAVVPPGVLDAALALEMVKRVQWGGDRRRGVARIELAAGAVIVLENEGRAVTLDITLAPGETKDDLPERLSRRLEARGIAVTGVTVR